MDSNYQAITKQLPSNYQGKLLLGQMVKPLGKSVIKMYLIGICATLGMNIQDALSEDLESDLFLNSALQRFTCELYNYEQTLVVGMECYRY